VRIALLSDIHSNTLALNVVLDAAKEFGVEKIFVTGDLIGYYYDAKGVLELLDQWDWVGIRGNHEDMLEDWMNGRNHQEIERSYGRGIAVTATVLTTAEIEGLLNLPAERIIDINGNRILLCHGSPWDKDSYVYPDAGDDEIGKMFDSDFNLLQYGHTHYPVIWRRNGRCIVNPGSVGQPRDRIPGACWALWDVDTGEIELMRESYDSKPLIAEVARIDPGSTYLAQVLERH